MSEASQTAGRVRPERNLSAASIFTTLVGAQMVHQLFSRKTIALVAAQALLVVLALGSLYMDEYLDGLTLFRNIVERGIFPFVIPLVALFYGGPTIVDEMEGRTLTYLTLRPIPKHLLYLGKLFGAVSVGAIVLMVPTLVLFGVCVFGGDDPAATPGLIVRLLGSCVLGMATYAVIFSALGAIFARSMLAGLVYFVIFEVICANLPILELSSVRFHVRVVAGLAREEATNPIMKLLMGDAQDPPLWIGLLVCTAILVTFTVVGSVVFRARQYDV